MRRTLSLLGFATLMLSACHHNGPDAGMPEPPMMYRATPAHHAWGNRSATRERIASCTSATALLPTPSGCSSAR